MQTCDTIKKRKRLFISSCVLLLPLYLSTPFLTILSPYGILDSLSGAIAALALCHILFTLPRNLSVFLASALLLAYMLFNIGNRFYFDQQQTYLSIYSLYLATEILSLLKALPQWVLAVGMLAAIACFALLTKITKLARPASIKTRLSTAAFLSVVSIGLQVSYARTVNEVHIQHGDTSPLGYMVRSSGYVPFFEQDAELTAMKEREGLIRQLLQNPDMRLPEKFSASHLGKLMGHGSQYSTLVRDQQYPISNSIPFINKQTTSYSPGKTNVLILVLESVRASEMGSYGAEVTATPFLDSLAEHHIFAERFYATSNFTVKSEHAIHCSSIDFMIGKPLAERDLPLQTKCLPDMLKESGYSTLWFHGNTKGFYNRDHYLPLIGFQDVFSRDELDPDEVGPVLGWGLDDYNVLDSALEILEKSEKPFYSEILTLSNHMPFDYEWGIEFPEELQQNSSMYDRYRRGIFYTDQAVQSFYEKFMASPLAENTILVITGDHGIWTFASDELPELQKNEQFFRVPLIIKTPDNVKLRITDNASHLDIAPTLASMLSLSEPADFMGQPLLEKSQTRTERVTYQMTEQALSYRFSDRACIPSIQCQGNTNCYRMREAEVPKAVCYKVDPSLDLLINPKATQIPVDPLTLIRDRALFEYSQIGLTIGMSEKQK